MRRIRKVKGINLVHSAGMGETLLDRVVVTEEPLRDDIDKLSEDEVVRLELASMEYMKVNVNL